MTLKFSRFLEAVEVHVHAKFHQAKCSGLRSVINSALDFVQLYTSMANISETGQAIDKQKTALATTSFSMFVENNFVNFGPLTKKWPWPLTLKFNKVHAVVKVHVPAKFHQAECSGSWVIVLTEKKNFDENNTVRRYRAASNKRSPRNW